VQYFELNDSTPTKRKHYELAEEYSDYEVGLFYISSFLAADF
jgi:hypothetical protein